ncbi:MAG: ABC transporter substrate-binding protein [Firmicutes bacterium]|nr:ABC transporter substrate-binding protein [Bacillota bacterium]
MKKLIALLLGLVLILSFAACGKSSKTPAVEQITIGTTAVIEKAVISEYNYEMLSSAVTHLPLVWQDTEGNFHPLLASYSTEDAKTWTYTIEDGMKWSDGQPVTAEDILFTLQYEDENGSANLSSQTDKDGNTVAAKYTEYKLSDDKKSISLTLATANVRELGNMTSFRVLPKHIYEGKDQLTDDEARIGNGPYVFENFSKDSGTITFVANKNYKEVPNVQRIVYQLFGNEDTMYMALEKGDIDMVWIYSTGVGASYQDVLSNSENVQLIRVAATNAPAVLAFNNEKGPFANEDLRKAVRAALDYDQLRTKVGSVDAQTPNKGFVPTSTIGYKETEKLATDLTAAEQYMNAAGYTKNADGKFADADGKVFGFTLTFRSDRANQVSCADLIKNALESFGIEVTLEGLDSASYNAKTSNKFSENNITMEAALFGYTSAGMSMGSGLGTIYVDGTHAVQGGCQVFDESFKAAVTELGSASTLDEYVAAAAKVQDYYAEHAPLVGLYWDSLTYGASSKLENLTVDNVFGLNNANNWFTLTVK